MADLSAVASRRWDAVVDSCGYVPRVVGHSVEALKHAVGRYLFVSSISVYEEDEQGGIRIPNKPKVETEEITGETYGPLKVECEEVVGRAFGDRSLVIRPGLVAGPLDPSNRFTYWVERLTGGGKVLVPDLKSQPLQVIDARDLGAFMVLALEKQLSSAFDVAGEQTTFGTAIETCHRLNPATELVWAPVGFLESEGVKLWADLPLTFPSSEGGGLMKVPSGRAVDQGLTRRPLFETARDTHEWALSNPATNPPHGMSRARELEVLKRLADSTLT